MIPPLINQEGGWGDIFWMLFPILCCLILMTQSRGGGGGRSEPTTESESWYTTQGIETTYESVESETSEWRKEAEERAKEQSESFTSKLRGVFGGGKEEERFIIKESIPPRLYRLDDSTGPIYFEFTEVEGGGTVVKATYNSSIKSRMAKFKAGLPLKIPAAPIGNRCPACGKSVLPEFNLCPYCGEKLITEE